MGYNYSLAPGGLGLECSVLWWCMPFHCVSFNELKFCWIPQILDTWRRPGSHQPSPQKDQLERKDAEIYTISHFHLNENSILQRQGNKSYPPPPLLFLLHSKHRTRVPAFLIASHAMSWGGSGSCWWKTKQNRVEKGHLNFKSFANFSMEENGKTNKRFHYMKSPLPSFRFPSSTACLATTTTTKTEHPFCDVFRPASVRGSC